MKFTKLSRTAFAFCAAIFVLAACGPNPNPNGVTDTGSINGVVIDSKTNQPLPTATVYVGTIVHNIVPSDHGQFTLNNVPIGQQTLVIQAIGYPTEREVIAVTKGQNSNAGDNGTVRLVSNLTP
jgi:hypothetical protein